MPLPEQTFNTIQQLISYINEVIIPNGVGEITGTEHNNVENALASFIVKYTLNSANASIVTSGGGAFSLAAPITLFTAVPSSITWPDNVQNEYYIINATGTDLPIIGGLSYINAFQVVQTSFPARNTLHIAKATNGQWIQVNNLSGSGGTKNYAHSIFAPNSGDTVNLVNNQYNILNPSGTLATLTVAVPSFPSNNDVVYIKFTNAITALSFSNGTVVGALTAAPAGGLIVLTFDGATSSWY